MTFELLSKKYRWMVYNKLKPLTHDILLNDKTDELEMSICDCTNRHKSHLELVRKFNRKDFKISHSLVKEYEDEEKEVIKKFKSGELRLSYFPLSNFINLICEKIDPSNKKFNDNIIKRISCYYSWDLLSKKELIQNITNWFFLDSTRKLIGKEKLMSYLDNNYNSKEDIIFSLFENFKFDEEWIIQVFSELFNDVITLDYSFDNYEMLFRKTLNHSIRFWENKIRIDNGEKIIGSFFNEDLLFKKVLSLFGDKYTVISQGSPSWLSPQRLDIYIPELNLGIEYQGEQHYRPVDFGGKGKKISKKQFKLNQERDMKKKNLCVKNKLKLLELRYDEDMNKFIEKLQNKYN